MERNESSTRVLPNLGTGKIVKLCRLGLGRDGSRSVFLAIAQAVLSVTN